MEASLLEQLEKLSVHSETTTAPSIPSEIIQHILGFLDPKAQDTLTTLLHCQLVSRSFAAASLAPVVWRPLVKATWGGGTLRYPAHKLPYKKDQKLVDKLFPSPSRAAPSDPFAIFRARSQLDGLARKHIDLLTNGTKDRLVSITTTSMLGDQIWQQVDRSRLVGNRRLPFEPIAFTQSWWCKEILSWASCFRAVETWRAIFERRIVGEEAIELGILAFDAFALGADADATSRFFESNLPLVVQGLQQDGHRGSDSNEPFEELRRLLAIIIRVYEECKITLPRRSDLTLESEGPLDQMFLRPAITRLDLPNGPPLSDFPLHPTAFATIFLAFTRRLPAPFAITVKLCASDCYVIAWKDKPHIACLMNMRRGIGAGSLYSAADMTEEEHERCLKATEVLARYGDEMSLRAASTIYAQADQSRSRSAYAASIIGWFMFEADPEERKQIFPQLRQQFLPPRALAIPVLKHCVLPTLSDAHMVEKASEIIKELDAEDSKTITPQRRPRDGSFNLKLRVGDTFLLRSTGALGVVAGWEALEGASTGAAQAKQRAKPLPRRIEYVYLAILESHTQYHQPIRLRDAEIDTTRRPLPSQVQTLINVASIGRLFNQCIDDFSTIVLAPSAETLARWPDG